MIERFNATGEVWLCAATLQRRPERGRGCRDDASHLPGLWLDIDLADKRYHAAGDLPPDVDAARRLLGRFELPPTAIVHTGHGLQPWWLFHEPLEASDADELLDRWEVTWQGRAAEFGWHIDSVFDVVRLLRVPGTVNRKRNRLTGEPDAAPVTVLEADWSRRYGPDDLLDLLDDLPTPTPEKPLTAGTVEGGWLTETIADYNQRSNWPDTLAGHFEDVYTDRRGIRYWHYRDAAHRVSATTNANGTDRFVLHSGTAHSKGWPTPPTSLDRFSAACFIATGRHDTDARTEFARQLQEQGFGPARPGADDLSWISTGSTEPSASADGDGDGAPDHVVYRRAADYKPERVRWLWEGRLALGTLGLVAGREGTGKSTVVDSKAADITRGRLPGEFYGIPKTVMVCATEDSWRHTILPRFMAHDADLGRIIHIGRGMGDLIVGLNLPEDLEGIARVARKEDAALLVLDPLLSRLDSKLDSHKDAEVRRALEPLVAMAERVDLAILGLIHHNKSGSSDPLELVMASRAFAAVARSVHTVVKDPDDETKQRRFFGTPKNNLGRSDLPLLSFTIESFSYPTDDGSGVTGQIQWGDEVRASIDDVLLRGAQDPDELSAADEARVWLDEYIILHGPTVASADAKRDGKAAGHSQRSIERARKALGLAVDHQGFPRRTYWTRPSDAKNAPSQTIGATGATGEASDTPKNTVTPTESLQGNLGASAPDLGFRELAAEGLAQLATGPCLVCDQPATDTSQLCSDCIKEKRTA